VNLKEQGQLIRQDEFNVFFRKKKCVRRIFLFEDLILFSKTKKTVIGNDVYVYKQSFKVSTHPVLSKCLIFNLILICTIFYFLGFLLVLMLPSEAELSNHT